MDLLKVQDIFTEIHRPLTSVKHMISDRETAVYEEANFLTTGVFIFKQGPSSDKGGGRMTKLT